MELKTELRTTLTSGVKVRPTLISPQNASSFTTLYDVGGIFLSSNKASSGILEYMKIKLVNDHSMYYECSLIASYDGLCPCDVELKVLVLIPRKLFLHRANMSNPTTRLC